MKLQTETIYYDTGEIKVRYTYYINEFGIRSYHGIYKSWYKNGQLKQEYEYYNNIPNGKQIYYSNLGVVFWICNYKHGELMGYDTPSTMVGAFNFYLI